VTPAAGAAKSPPATVATELMTAFEGVVSEALATGATGGAVSMVFNAVTTSATVAWAGTAVDAFMAAGTNPVDGRWVRATDALVAAIREDPLALDRRVTGMMGFTWYVVGFGCFKPLPEKGGKNPSNGYGRQGDSRALPLLRRSC